MHITVFFAWQSDSPAPTGRTLVEAALRTAIGQIAADVTIDLRPDVDQDTQLVPGSPPVVSTILEKIDRCSVFVADVTLTHQPRDGRPKLAPNPNVAFELGYAIRRLTHGRTLLVMNDEYGGPEQLPFDLRGLRAIPFQATGGSAAYGEMERSLADKLEREIRLVLRELGPPSDVHPPISLSLSYRELTITQDRHDYRLIVAVENQSSNVLENWAVEVQIPRALLNPRESIPEDQSSSTGQRVVMRLTEQQHSGPIYPDSKKEVFGMDYHMDDELYGDRDTLFADTISASFFVGGKRLARHSKAVRDMQVF